MNSGTYILVADSHIRDDSAGDFFVMLEQLRQAAPAGVIFLGDIFELWIALDGYETAIHQRFLDWCSQAKQQFEVGFILGNHEFYVAERHRNAFTWIDEVSHTMNREIQFVHGDLINRSDTGYLLLRKILRNRFTRFLLKITARTIGPRISDQVRKSLKPTNQRHKRQLPAGELEKYSQAAAADKIRQIFAGHFHQHVQLNFPEGAQIEILPAWDGAGEILCLSPGQKTVCAPWREMLCQSWERPVPEPDSMMESFAN